eukprot:826867_1
MTSDHRNSLFCSLLFLVICQGVSVSDLDCKHAKNIAYSNIEGDNKVIGVFPLNECVSFFQISTNRFESERYSCDKDGNLRVHMWYNNGNCDGDSDYWTTATADSYNCKGGRCENMLYLTQTNRYTESSSTCPETDGDNDKQGKAFHIYNECYKFEKGSMMETCDDNAVITYYQYSDLNCTQNKQA